MSEISDFGKMVQPPQKGDPIYDIIGILEYCDKYKIDRKNGAPKEVADKFIIGYH